jgi:iron transport multicopper oxidase
MPQDARRAVARAVLLAAAAVLLALLGPAAAFGSEPTNSGDNLRDGWYPEQGSLTPQLVSGGTFGQLWSANVEGSVYAQPLLVNGEVLVATENNKVYALNPNTGAAKWSVSLQGTAWKAGDIGCSDLAPNVGVTGTPVVDPATNTAYMTHKGYVSGSSGAVRWYMDAINLENGQEREGFPVQLQGTAQNCSTASSTRRSARTATSTPGRDGSSASRPPARSRRAGRRYRAETAPASGSRAPASTPTDRTR